MSYLGSSLPGRLVWSRLMVIVLAALAPAAAGQVNAADYYLWMLDEQQGNAAVDSGTRGIDLDIASPAWSKDSPLNGAGSLSLDGSGKTYLGKETHIQADEMSVEMWIKPASATGEYMLFSSRYTSTSRFYFYMSAGSLHLSDQWWSEHRDLTAPNAFTPEDAGKWIHIAFTSGGRGYKLYKNGKLLAEKEGRPLGTPSDYMAIGINAWDRKASPFKGELSQARITLAQLEPGNGTGKDELAWAASLAPQRIVRPTFEWQPAPREGNLFIRQEKPVLGLKVRNRFYEPIPKSIITLSRRNLYTGRTQPPLKLQVAALAPREERTITVDLGISQAGVYQVSAVSDSGVETGTSVTRILGPKPPDATGPISFFGNSSHHAFAREDFQLRREFGSRAERGSQLLWPELKDGKLSFDTSHLEMVKSEGSEAFAFTGYTPSYANPLPKEKQQYDDMPIIDKYRDWVEAGSKAFNGLIRYWEIWNEPNGDGAFFRGSAEQLADLHKTAYLAVKRVDHKLKIVGASLVYVDPEYMDRLQDAGAVDYMDVIAFHHYCWDYPPDSGMLRRLNTILGWRDKNAPGRPMWDDEWGYTPDANITPTRHANMVARQLIITRAMGVQHSDYYTWDGADSRLMAYRWATPSALAYRTVAQHLTNATPLAAVAEGKDGYFAYVFRTGKDLTLAAWCPLEKQTHTLSGIPVAGGNATLYDTMGNASKPTVNRNTVNLTLGNGPVFLVGVSPEFLKGVKRLQPPPNGAPPKRHPSLWFSFHYPTGSEVFSLPTGATRLIDLTVYNDGQEPASGKLSISSPDGALTLSVNEIKVSVAPRSSTIYRFRVTARDGLKDGVHRIRITSLADKLSFGNMNIRCYVSGGDTKLFHMATWEMAENLLSAEGYGQGIHIRWISPGGFLKFKFDLTGATKATLSSYIDSSSPALTDGGNFRLSASTDDKTWDILLEGIGEFAWRDVNLSPYAGKQVIVRFDNASEKGEARIRQMKLTTFPAK